MRRLLLLNAHGLDLLTLLWALSLGGIGGEANPVIRSLFVTSGPLGIVAIKSAGVGVFAWKAASRRTLLTFGIWLGIVGALANVVSIGLIRGAL